MNHSYFDSLTHRPMTPPSISVLPSWRNYLLVFLLSSYTLVSVLLSQSLATITLKQNRSRKEHILYTVQPICSLGTTCLSYSHICNPIWPQVPCRNGTAHRSLSGHEWSNLSQSLSPWLHSLNKILSECFQALDRNGLVLGNELCPVLWVSV